MKFYRRIGLTTGNYSHYIKCEKYSDILNNLGVTHEWDRQTDRWPLAVIVCSNLT